MRAARRRSAPWRWLLLATAVVAVVAVPGAVTPSSATAPDPSADTAQFTTSRQISRVHLVDGQDHVVEQQTFHVSVSNTTSLRGHQTIDVKWSGAHPTGGILLDPNSGASTQEEYPVVLLQCAGIDGDDAPAAERLTPETCWTATPYERFQNSGVGDAFPPYRLDRYADPSDRAAIVDEPVPRPSQCGAQGVTERWLHFRTLAGADYPNGPVLGCGGMAPEAVTVGDTLAFPSNTTYATTELDGTGSAKFDVWTREQNASLACSQDTPCSLVVVPILGLSCDADAASLPLVDRPAAGEEANSARTACESTGQFAPGERTFLGRAFDLSVSGALWWSASNWRNRVTVPLDFAPPPNVCDILGSGSGVELYGSELMSQATAQWSPRFCLDPGLFKLRHVQTPEPQARASLMDGSVHAVLSSSAPDGGFATPTVSAPVGMTGFAISFTVDDSTRQQLHHLKLTPRLLAKLLTGSYPAVLSVQAQHPTLRNNPLDITNDPEFAALNPGAPKSIGNSVSAATLVALSSDSDVMWALTSYIDGDPEARAFLDGTPDPWGMIVNPAYQGIDLPTTGWPLLDTFVPEFSATANACLHYNPVPFAPLVAAPMSRLFQIAQGLQFAVANSTTNCFQPVEGDFTQIQLKPIGREFPGFRFMIGVTSLADARRYGLDTAELQTSSTAPSGERFSDTSGRTFVAAGDDGLRAAVATLRPDETTRTWPLNSTTIHADEAHATEAYPGAMIVYAQVPTAGLPAEEAAQLAAFLRFAVTDGQDAGYGNGQLPPGYLAMTDANGLGDLASYTQRAADAVEAQSGTVPDLVAAHSTGPDGAGAPVGGTAPDASPYGADDWSADTSLGDDGYRPLDAWVDVEGSSFAEDPASSDVPAAGPATTTGDVVISTVGYLSGSIGRLLPLLVLVALAAAAVAATLAIIRLVRRRAVP